MHNKELKISREVRGQPDGKRDVKALYVAELVCSGRNGFMSANSNMASSPLTAASANAQSGSALDRAVRRVKDIKAGDLLVNAMWVVLAGYGLAATVNVLLTY